MAHTHDTHGNGHGEYEHHIIPPSTYLKVFLGLMALLILTLVVAVFDFGPVNLAVALAVALVKVYLIMTFFMHLKFNTSLVRLFATGTFFWLLIMFVLTLADYISRGWIRQ